MKNCIFFIVGLLTATNVLTNAANAGNAVYHIYVENASGGSRYVDVTAPRSGTTNCLKGGGGQPAGNGTYPEWKGVYVRNDYACRDEGKIGMHIYVGVAQKDGDD